MHVRLTGAAGIAALSLLAACGDRNADKADAAAPAAGAEVAPATATLSPAEEQEARSITVQLLNRVGEELARDNYQAVPGMADHDAPLAQGGTGDWTVNLRGGQAYRLVGVCHFGCTNLDMELRDASGAVVASDVLEDDVPVVEFTPSADGTYTARLIMVVCEKPACLASARAFQRG